MSSFAIFPEHIEFLANFSKNYIKKDGSIGLSGNLDLGLNKIINIDLTPINPGDVASKSYVDTVLTGGSSNVVMSGYLQLNDTTQITEHTHEEEVDGETVDVGDEDTWIKNTSSGQNILLETDGGDITFSVNAGISDYLSLSSLGILTIHADIIFSETLGILTKTSSHEVCFKYNEGLVVDTDYAIKQNNTGKTTINSASSESVSINISDTEYMNISSTTILTGNDLNIFKSSADDNPFINMGSSETETLHIQSLYDSGDVTLDKITFTTKTASATADKGSMEFYVDEELIISIDDDALNLASGKHLEVDSVPVLTANALGSTILSSSLTAVGTLTKLDLSGSITQTGGDIFLYDTANNSNPSIVIGSSANEAFTIQSVYDEGTAYLSKTTFSTKAVAQAGDLGNMEFYVSETLILTMDSTGLNLADTKEYKINDVTVLTADTLGANILSSSLTSVGTLESISVNGNSDLEGYVSIGNGSPLDENVGLIIDYDKTYSALGRQLLVQGSVTAATNTSVYGVQIAPEGITIPGSSTSPLITSLYIDEPKITELVQSTSFTTLATTLYIEDEPTEGATNYAMYVNNGASHFGGNVNVAGIITMEQVIVDTTNGTFKIWDGLNTEFEVDNNGVISIGTGDEAGAINIGTDGTRTITIGKQTINDTTNIYMYSYGNSYIETDAGIELIANGERDDGNGDAAVNNGTNFGHGNVVLKTVDNGDIILTAGMRKLGGNIILTAGSAGVVGSKDNTLGYVSITAEEYVDVENVRFTGNAIGVSDNSGLTLDADLITLTENTVTIAGDILPQTDDTHNIGSSSLKYDNIYATSGVVNTSDMRTKTNIVESDLGLDFINQLNPVSYNWINPNNDNIQKHYGLISQEVKSVTGDNFGGFVAGTNPEELQGLRYNEFIAPMIQAIKDLSNKVEELEKKLENHNGSV